MRKQQRVLAILNAYFKRRRRQERMTKEQAEQFFTRHNWTRDKWGHFHKTQPHYRATVTTHSIKIEVKAGCAGWVRIKSGYLRDVTITPDDKLSGLSVRGCSGQIPRSEAVGVLARQSTLATPHYCPVERSQKPGAE